MSGSGVIEVEQELGMAAHADNPSIWEVEAG